MSHLIPSAAGYKTIVCDFFSRMRLKMCKFCWPSHTHTQWNVNQNIKILLKWVFSLYIEIILKSDLYLISPSPRKEIKFLLVRTAFNVTYLMYT